MKEFILVFRRDLSKNGGDLTPEQLQAMMKPWQDWMGGDGRVVSPDKMITNGPYVEMKEALAGVTMVRAENIDEAAEMAKGCPVLNIGGCVEVRPIVEG